MVPRVGRWVSVISALALAAVGVLGTAVPAGGDVTEVGQGAASFLINVEVAQVGPIETVITPVNLPPTGGGPFTDSLASFSEPTLTLEADALSTSTEGGNLGTHQGFATSSAELANLRFSEILGADAVQTECTANGDGATGSTTLANAVVNVGGVGTAIEASPAPNTQFTVVPGVTVTVNEQLVTNTPGALTQIVVNAFHVEFEEGNQTAIVGDIWIAQSICRASGPDVLLEPEPVAPATAEPVRVEPRFTG